MVGWRAAFLHVTDNVFKYQPTGKGGANNHA
jgi:hypothetical protein